MKKILLTMLGVAGILCSTSCSDEEIVSNLEGDAVAEFTVELSDGNDASRAISDGLSVNELYYEVYSVKDGVATLMSNLDAMVDMNVVNGVNTATVRLALVKGQAYDVVFWAQTPGAYDATDLQNITVAPTTANNEAKDAFTAVYRTDKVTGPIKETIVLTRPFAQVNFGTLDVEAAKKAGITFSESQIVVSNAASTYNALTEQAAATGSELTFGFANVPDMEKEALVVSGTTYEYLATAYVLVPGDDTQKLSDLKMEIETGLNEIITLSVPNAPVQRNYRTNVLGNLLTNTADFNIVVDPIYNGDYNPIDMLNKVLTEGGEFKLFSDIVLTEPITIPAGVDAKIDLNECTMTVNSSNRVEGSLTLSNGNLDIDVAGEGDLKLAFTARNGSTVSLDGVNVSVADKSAAVYVPNSSVEATINISNTTMTIDGEGHGVTAPEGAKNLAINVEESTLTGKYAFYLMNTNSVVTIDNKSSVKDFWVMGGNVTVVYEGNKPEIKTDGLAVNITYYNEGEYALMEAIKEGGEVTLTEDVTLTAPLNVANNLVLNLNGKTITGDFSDKDNDVVIENAGTLKLVGGTIKNTAENGAAVINNSGTLVLEGVKIEGAPIGATGYPAYAVYTSGSVVVENGTVISSDRGAINMSNGADVTINGGNIFVTDALGTRVLTAHVIYAYGKNSKLTINDGNFALNYVAAGGTGASVICPAGAAIDVYGGNFSYAGTVGQSAVFQNYMGYGAPVNVYGGTYSDSSVKKNVAEGYVAIQNTDGTYTVKKGTAANDAASLETALSNATPGSTIVLSGTADYGTVEVGELKDVTIEGDENSTVRFVTSADSKIENVTVKNVDFGFVTGAGQTGGAFVVINKDAQIDNLVIENCAIVGDGKKNSYGIYGQNPNASIVVRKCSFSNMGYPIQAIAAGGYESLTVEGCTFDNIISWAIMPQYGSYSGDLTVTGCKFNNSNGGIIKSGALTADHTFTFTNNTITNCTGHDGKDSKWFEFTTSAGTAIISGNLKDGQAWEPGASEGLTR